jgi:uncharacterized protein (DUF486 family)
MSKHITDAVQFILIGVLVMLGMRAVEWTIPAPSTRIVFCMYEDGGHCKTLQELKESGK